MAFSNNLAFAWRRWRHRRRGVQIGPGTRICSGVFLRPGGGTIAIGEACFLDTGVVLETWSGRVAIDPHVFIGPHAVIYGHGGVRIGAGTLISMHCRILSSNHTVAPYGTEIRLQPDIPRPTSIGRDVWLGAGVTVLGGVTIGDGCVVGAGAVVTKDLPPGCIAYGVPAVIQGQRAGAPTSD